jgi:hypothetical protein
VYDQTEYRQIYESGTRKAVVSQFITFSGVLLAMDFSAVNKGFVGYVQGTTSLLLFPLFFDLPLEQTPKGRANLHLAVKADFDERHQRGLGTSNERSWFVWSSLR